MLRPCHLRIIEESSLGKRPAENIIFHNNQTSKQAPKKKQAAGRKERKGGISQNIKTMSSNTRFFFVNNIYLPTPTTQRSKTDSNSKSPDYRLFSFSLPRVSQLQYCAQIAYSSLDPRNLNATGTTSWNPSLGVGSRSRAKNPLNAMAGRTERASGLNCRGPRVRLGQVRLSSVVYLERGEER